MSRRRGEFEHRTSIFEGAFRAWSHLGGLDPNDLESKSAAELDPLNFPIINDPRLALQKEKDEKKKAAKEGGSGNNSPAPQDDSGDNGGGGNYNNRQLRNEYPYEPLPRSGLAHPFVQAILSPWLGPDADQDAIQLGLTTLRTWWQHRRKGESGSAIVALGTEKMKGVVEGYTRHFFNLAHCLIVTDKEQPPRSLQTKMKDLDKTRGKKGGKKRSRESSADEDAIKAASMAFSSGFGGGVAPVISAVGGDNAIGGAGAVGGDSMLGPLERLQAAQARQLASVGGVHSSLAGGMALESNPAPPQIDMKGRCMPGRVDLPGLVQKVSSAATQLAHRGIKQSVPGVPVPAVDPSKYGDPNITPIVLVSQNGDLQICMNITGITCAHCVKIVETVLKGCPGNGSPIEGVLDASGDQELNLVLIKIEKVADARRIAFEAARNLTMVGYTAVSKSINIAEVAAKGNNEVTLQKMYSAFESLPHLNPMAVMNWELECACPDNNVMRQNCPRHSQMSQGTVEVFDKAAELVTQYINGCGKKYGMQCTAGNHCVCKADQQQVAEMNQYEQPIHQGGGDHAGPAPRPGKSRMSMRMSLGRMSGRMSIGGLSGLSNLTSGETTFGRAMSGLSALSIDWENMDDFDINVDHSEGINNDIVNAQQQQLQQKGEDNPVGNMREPNYEYEAAGPGAGPRVARRSSLKKNLHVNPGANNMNVSFNM
eukprot:CAMPEP_0201716366 /NCGR_PEP_ID=MMETSP0593-20130828/2357_1 /ASSEMBLY_ACC=CAM_ASM_000672 /TAXON_ID=267983 /ORGANISM="Skeletonema japonicum, Strain CCMP2506" /LENGTH=709 /DNA_ID=CAMNT_0048206157 /DNA_START=221 /DNA_END=2350 /DNA_ORIENTATION=-